MMTADAAGAAVLSDSFERSRAAMFSTIAGASVGSAGSGTGFGSSPATTASIKPYSSALCASR